MGLASLWQVGGISVTRAGMEPASLALEGEVLTTGLPGKSVYCFYVLFNYGLLQNVEYSPLCYAVGPCCYPFSK